MSERFVVLLRHGIAEKKGAKPDAKRALTAKGHAAMKQIAAALAEIFPDAGVIYSSPLRRCVQTADWVARAQGLEVMETEALSPDGDGDQVRKLIERSDAARIICVGHEPNLSQTMLALTHMRGEIELKKGGCYGIRWVEGEEPQLEWMIPPHVLTAS
jgi:phosphohistidine phosphatase SixA